MALSVDKKLEIICERVGFLDVRKILSFKHGITSNSTHEFISKFKTECAKNPSIETAINEFWEDTLLGGERLAQLHKVKSTDIKGLDKALKVRLAKGNVNSFSANYPYPMAPSKLKAMNNSFHVMSLDTHYVSGNKSGLTVAMICSKSSYTTTEPIKKKYLSTQGVSLLSDAEIICKKRHVTQCFDLIIYDASSNLVLVASDASVLSSSVESGSHLKKLNSFIRKDLGMGLTFDRPINVFPAIPKLYAKKDGRISLLSFITADGNPSTLRTKAFKEQCLRADSYHKGGEDKARVLNKYKLGKLWKVPLDKDLNVSPGLEIHGLRKMAEGLGDPLNHFRLLNCFSLSQTMFTVDKLVEVL